MGKTVNAERRESPLQRSINSGYVSDNIRKYLTEIYDELVERNSQSWDKEFIKNMLMHKKKLTDKQIEQLSRILGYKVLEEEYPGGICDILNSIDTLT